MTSLPSDTFARRLRAEREHHGYTQAELARKMARTLGSNIDPSAVTRIEQQTRAVRLDEAVAMAQALETPLAALLSEDAGGQNEHRVAELMIDLVRAQREWSRVGEEVARIMQQIQALRDQDVARTAVEKSDPNFERQPSTNPDA